ncbi:MAG: hypothetical protein QOJ40_1544, partial [Verrucomicrobiota bacterium]
WCERGILGLALCILVFGPLAMGAVDAPAFLIIQGMTLGIMLLWGARFWLNARPQLLWPPICWAVAAFTLYAVVRYFTSDIEYVARQELIRVLVYACLFFAVLNNLHRRNSVQLFTFALVSLAMLISAYAIWQFLTGSTRVWNMDTPYKHQGTGTYISPNHLGGFLEMLLPLGLAYALASRLPPLGKVFVGYAALMIVTGIGVTVSRGAWISTGLALFIFFGVLAFHRSYRLPAFVFLVAIIGAGVFFIPRTFSIQARFRQLIENGQVNDDLRFALWKPAIQLWEENPWWGIGPGHYDYRFRQYRPEIVQARPVHAHNDFLNTLADWGVIGTAIVAAAWGLLCAGVLKTWRFVRGSPGDLATKPSNKFAFVLGASLGLLALLFHSVVDFNMHIPANAILAVTLMALLSSHLRFLTERYWLKVNHWGKIAATALVVVGSIYLAEQGWRRASEYKWLRRASLARAFSPMQAGLLARAFAAEPRNAETAYALGEAYRIQSLEGGPDYRELANAAMEWFGRCIKLNPYDGYGFLRYGMCLDWAERSSESAPYFDRAEQLDPNGYYTVANIGLHYVELGSYAAARPWFDRANRLESENNEIARNYLALCNIRLMEAATNDVRARIH